MSTPGPLVTELATRTLIAPGIADLSFKMVTPAELSFRAGQFVSIPVEGADTSSPSRRSYSIASQSDAGSTLRFIIRVIPTGAASELLMAAPIGASMRMTGPHGFFVLDQEHGDIKMLLDKFDQAHQVFLFGRGHPGGRFVQQQ